MASTSNAVLSNMPLNRCKVLLVEYNYLNRLDLYGKLTQCNYEVIEFEGTEEAAQYFGKFDMVVIGDTIPNYKRFSFLQHISSHYTLPIIMISIDKSPESVTHAINLGCCGYYSHPLERNSAELMWQHIVHYCRQQQINNNINISIVDNNEEVEVIDDNHDVAIGERKKPRVVWTDELHKQFVRAFNILGQHGNAIPKRILKIMQENPENENLTRENVASHLQKYRTMLKKNKEIAKRSQNSSLPHSIRIATSHPVIDQSNLNRNDLQNPIQNQPSGSGRVNNALVVSDYHQYHFNDTTNNNNQDLALDGNLWSTNTMLLHPDWLNGPLNLPISAYESEGIQTHNGFVISELPSTSTFDDSNDVNSNIIHAVIENVTAEINNHLVHENDDDFSSNVYNPNLV